MICGYLPFEDQNTKKLYQKIIKADYKMPSFLSEHAQDLINNILNPDPTSRFGIDDIRNHPWFAIHDHQPPYTQPIYPGEKIPVDAKIIEVLVRDHKIDQALVESEIRRSKISNNTTTYYLLLKRKERAGMFRQQYFNDDVKKLLRRGKKSSPSPTPT